VSGLNRRGLLAGAGAAAAAGVVAVPSLPALATPQPFSPEFLEYQRRRLAWLACFVEPYSEDTAWEAKAAVRSDAMEEAVLTMIRRPCRSWQDVIELAILTRQELWEENDGKWECTSDHEEIEPALIEGVLAVAGLRVVTRKGVGVGVAPAEGGVHG
jgi:hypothetical protein